MLVQALCKILNVEQQAEHKSEIDDPVGPSVWDQNKDHLRSQGDSLLSFHALSPTNPLRLMRWGNGSLSAELTSDTPAKLKFMKPA